MATLFFYQIVSEDGQPIVNGNCYISDFEAAKHHIETVSARKLAGKSNLEAILKDITGHEIWRGSSPGSERDT
jgi:hypothetical protein